LNSEDGRERVRAINYITSLARGNLFLRWSMLWAIFSIIISGLNLMIDNSALLAGSIMAFLAQIYLFIWGLLFSEFLPS